MVDEEHEVDARQLARAGMEPVLETCRKLGLMLPVGAQLNDLPMLDPVARTLVVAKVIASAMDQGDMIEEVVRNGKGVATLRDAAGQRKNKQVDAGEPFKRRAPVADGERSA